MPIVYSQTTINNRLLGVVTTIDAGSGNGIMNLFTSSGAIGASITLNKPSGTVSGGLLTFSGLPLVTPNTLTAGTLVSANITDSNNNIVASGLTIGTLPTFDIVMAVTTILANQNLALTNATITGS